MAKITIDNWVRDIKNSIYDDVKDVAENYHAKRQKGGYFSIPRQIFCYIDYLGKIAFGLHSSTERAVKFIKDYFPKEYHDYANLIYLMWRHGTVHEYKPKDLLVEVYGHKPEKIRIKWCSNNDNDKNIRKEHLKFFPMLNKRATLYLNINNCQLVDDLLEGLENFVNHLKQDKKIAKQCQKHLKEDWRYEKVKQIIKIRKIVQSTIINKNNPVYNQMLSAWKNRSADKLDKSGNTIKNNP